MQDDYILQYDGDKKTAQKLGAFYTPPELGRRMVDKFSQSLVGKTCLDNCCYDADTEFFSQSGWKKISEYSINDQVMQFNSDGTGSLVKPLAFIKKQHVGHWIKFIGTQIDALVTDNHNMVVKQDNNINRGLYKLTADYIYQKSLEVGNLHLAVPNSFIYDGNLEVDENILRLAVAINADGTWRKHLTAAGNSQKTARNTKFTKNDTAIRDIYEIRVKKLRKADRLRILLNNANIAYDNKSYACKDGFYYCFRFRFPFNAKVFPDEWFNLSLKCKKILINELFYWDGNIQMKASIDKNHVRKTYSTSKKHDADFIEFVLASSGIGVHTYLDLRSKHINYNISPISHQVLKLSSAKIEKVDNYNGYAYCFTVPSGMLVIRRNHKIYICGNCGYGNLILQVLDKKVEQGEDPAKALSEVYGNEFSRKNLEVCIRNLRIWADRHGVKWNEDLIRSHFRQGDALTDKAYEFPDEKFGMDRHFEVEIRKDLGKAWLKVIVESRIRKEREYSLPDESDRLKNSIRRLLDLKFKMLKIEG